MKRFALPFRYGIAICGILVGYFLLLALIGWHTNPFFSLFNGAITGFGIYEVIKIYKLRRGSEFTYADGFSTGVVTGFVATLLFTFFFGVYAGNIAPQFLENLIGPWSGTASLGTVLFSVAISGFATSVVMTLSFMQLFKTSWNTTKSTKESSVSESEIVID